MVYEEAALGNVIDDFQMSYGIGIRLDSDVVADQLVTYESIGRTAFLSLTDLLQSMKLGFAIVNDEIRIMKESNPELVINATYNVAGLNSLAEVKTDDLLKVLKESFAVKGVKFSKLGNSTILAKTTEQTQLKIQERIAGLAASRW
jgi:hypothetical protein